MGYDVNENCERFGSMGKAMRLQKKICAAEEMEVNLKEHLNRLQDVSRRVGSVCLLRCGRSHKHLVIVSTSPLGGMTDYQSDGMCY